MVTQKNDPTTRPTQVLVLSVSNIICGDGAGTGGRLNLECAKGGRCSKRMGGGGLGVLIHHLFGWGWPPKLKGSQNNLGGPKGPLNIDSVQCARVQEKPKPRIAAKAFRTCAWLKALNQPLSQPRIQYSAVFLVYVAVSFLYRVKKAEILASPSGS